MRRERKHWLMKNHCESGTWIFWLMKGEDEHLLREETCRERERGTDSSGFSHCYMCVWVRLSRAYASAFSHVHRVCVYEKKTRPTSPASTKRIRESVRERERGKECAGCCWTRGGFFLFTNKKFIETFLMITFIFSATMKFTSQTLLVASHECSDNGTAACIMQFLFLRRMWRLNKIEIHKIKQGFARSSARHRRWLEVRGWQQKKKEDTELTNRNP